MRRAAALVLGIALFGVGGFLLQSWVSGDGLPQEQPEPGTAAPIAAAQDPAPAAPAMRAAPLPGPVLDARQPRGPDSRPDGSALAESRHLSRKARRTERALFQRQLTIGVNRLRPLLDQCPNARSVGGIGGTAEADRPSSPEDAIRQLEAIAAKKGGDRADSRVRQMVLRHIERLYKKRAPPRQARGLDEDTSLQLEIALFDGKVEILDVADAMNGAVSDEFLACAGKLLRGQFVRVLTARAGGRLRTNVTLASGAQAAAPDTRVEEAREGELANAERAEAARPQDDPARLR